MPPRRTRRKPRARTLSRRVQRLERVSRPEVKYASAQSGGFDTVGSIQGTLLKPQVLEGGTENGQRVGDKVKSRNIRFQAVFKMPDAPSYGSCAIRILALRSKKQNPSSGTIDTGDFPNFYSTVDEEKFFVLKDILTQVSSTGANASDLFGSTVKKVKFNLSCGSRKIQYDGQDEQSPLNNEVIIFMVAEN